MGQLESESRMRLRKGQLKRALLSAVGISGLLIVGMAAPNVLQLLKYAPRSKNRFGNQTRTALSQLVAAGLVRFVEKRGKRYAELTEKGRKRMLLDEHMFRSAAKPKKWDGRWRIVMFDIPEKRRKARDALRFRMRELGFLRLQHSAWVFPFDCEDVIEMIKVDLGAGKDVLYMIADIQNDRHLRMDFSLPLRS